MAAATAKSVNTYFIQLEERTGLIAPPQIAESLGIRHVDGTGHPPSASTRARIAANESRG